MRKTKLNAKQRAVIFDLVAATMDEGEVLLKHGVGMAVYKNWLGDKKFADELDFVKGAAKRQSDLILAKYASVATAKLIELTGSDKEETARKACLDIISMPLGKSLLGEDKAAEASDGHNKLSPEMASKVLELIAWGE